MGFNEDLLKTSELFQCYRESPYLSLKHSCYFPVYDRLLGGYRGKALTLVEIGVLNGGSLFMWRRFFGGQARIIGVDLNPDAKRWEQDGFEIYIGNQVDPAFWAHLFRSVGDVDVVIDDGGHTYEQQIKTALEVTPRIKDGGLLIVEDTHTSYFRSFGYPTKWSFVNWAKGIADELNSRSPDVNLQHGRLSGLVHSISFYESMVVLTVNRSLCQVGFPTSNEGLAVNAQDFRHYDIESKLGLLAKSVLGTSIFRRTLDRARRSVLKRVVRLVQRLRNRDLKKYFSNYD